MLHVGDYVAERGHDRRIGWAHYSLYPELCGQPHAVEAGAASISDEGEVARVIAAPHGDFADVVHHVRLDYPDDPGGCLGCVAPQFVPKPRQRLLRFVWIDPHPSTQIEILVEQPKEQVGIGDRWLLTSEI